MEYTIEYNQGYNAYNDGKKEEDNPYYYDKTGKLSNWSKGWHDAPDDGSDLVMKPKEPEYKYINVYSSFISSSYETLEGASENAVTNTLISQKKILINPKTGDVKIFDIP